MPVVTVPVAEPMSDAVAEPMSDTVAKSMSDGVTHVVADCMTQARPEPMRAGVTEAHRVTHAEVSVDAMSADAMADSRTRTMSDTNAA